MEVRLIAVHEELELRPTLAVTEVMSNIPELARAEGRYSERDRDIGRKRWRKEQRGDEKGWMIRRGTERQRDERRDTESEIEGLEGMEGQRDGRSDGRTE